MANITRTDAMAVYNDDKRADVARMIAKGEKDAAGKAITPWVDLTYDQLAIMLCDEYLAEYVATVQSRQAAPTKPVITV